MIGGLSEPYFVLHPDAEMIDLESEPGAFLLVHPSMPTILVHPSGLKELYDLRFPETVQ